jgi:hypothetical protein
MPRRRRPRNLDNNDNNNNDNNMPRRRIPPRRRRPPRPRKPDINQNDNQAASKTFRFWQQVFRIRHAAAPPLRVWLTKSSRDTQGAWSWRSAGPGAPNRAVVLEVKRGEVFSGKTGPPQENESILHAPWV